MDYSTTAHKIAVMQAFIEGKPIQVCFKGNDKPRWIDRGSQSAPRWNWVDYDYRIKPEHRYLRDDSSTIWRTMEEWKELERNSII